MLYRKTLPNCQKEKKDIGIKFLLEINLFKETLTFNVENISHLIN